MIYSNTLFVEQRDNKTRTCQLWFQNFEQREGEHI